MREQAILNEITNEFLFNLRPHLRLAVPTRTATQLIWRHRRRVWQSQQPPEEGAAPPLPLAAEATLRTLPIEAAASEDGNGLGC